MFNFAALPPLGLYVHLPWCIRKCPYCDFNSHEPRGAIPEATYIESLIKDLENDLPLIWGRRVSSIFIGGGTPSLFSSESLNNLLSSIRARLPFSPDIEVTLEANPGAVEENKFREFRSLGINRISIGAQSFDDLSLQYLGRIHGSQEAISALETAHKAGFENVNIDLMFGLPQQSVSSAIKDVKTAIDLNPAHISYYQLTLEPNTLFHKNPPSLPGEEDIEEIQNSAQLILADNGYKQYEISAYARDGMRCRHNMNYWQFGDYLGIGAGAHAKISNASEQAINRYWKVKHPQEYMQKTNTNEHVGGSKRLSRSDAGLEFMMNALRLTDGFESRLFTENTGLPLLTVEKQLKEAVLKGLIERDLKTISPTVQGKLFLNDLLAMFMSDNQEDSAYN